MIVVDASTVVELVLQTPTGARVAARLIRDGDTLHVPHLLDLEVASALRRLEAAAAVTPAEASQGLATLAALDLVRYAHDIFVPRIWQLRQNVTVHDACYLALAETLQAPLLTCDARLAAARGHRAVVERP